MTTEIELDIDVICDRWHEPHRQNQHCLNPREHFPRHEAFQARITGEATPQPAPDTEGEWHIQTVLHGEEGYRVLARGGKMLLHTHNKELAAQIVSDHRAVQKIAAAIHEPDALTVIQEILNGKGLY